MPTHTYEPPVAELLRLGECQGVNVQEWPNYVQDLGLTPDHVPVLIQMAQDEELWAFFEGNSDRKDEFLAAGIDPDDALWAPIHAWRALGQLQAAEAIVPLTAVLQRYDLDWCWEEIPQVFGLIGAAAIDLLDELISTKIHYNNKVTLVGAFGEIVKTFPELRDRCVAVLTDQLSNFKNHHRTVNGALIAELIDLEAIDAVPVMEAAYAAKKVDEMFVGSWARVQVDLGLKQESDFTPEELAIHYTPRQEQMLANIRASLEPQQASSGQNFPPQLDAKPPEFSDIAAQAGRQKLANKAGFGGEAVASRKTKKKKKKKQ